MSTHDEFLAMYDATVDEVFRYARRLTGDQSRAEDLVQQVYLELLQSVRSGTIDQLGIGRLIVAVRSRFLNGLRSQGREERRLRLVSSIPHYEDVEDTGAVAELLSRPTLSDRERAALVLRYIDDLPVVDVATKLGTSVHATESLLARARTRLRTTENPYA